MNGVVKSCSINEEHVKECYEKLKNIDFSYYEQLLDRDSCMKFQFCTTLILAGNGITGDLHCLRILKRLETVDLSNNRLEELPEIFGSINTLKSLDVSHNLLSVIPEWVLLLKNVEHLNLSYNPFNKESIISLQKAKWPQITTCHLEVMNLRAMLPCLLTATRLKVLRLGNPSEQPLDCSKWNNLMWELSGQLPQSLEILAVNNLHLHNFHSNWKQLMHLKELHGQDNELFWFDDEFPLLSQLEVCNLSCNKLAILPKNMSTFVTLCYLNLSSNKLSSLPSSMEYLENLQHLDLYDNCIEIVECNLTKLVRLERCDLWMNCVEPSEFLPEHDKLCQALRNNNKHMENRVCKILKLVIDKYAEEESVFSSSEESELITTCPVVKREEECWDENNFSDDGSHSPVCTNYVAAPKDEHFFLPAENHPRPHTRTILRLKTIQGQFDDAEDD